MSRLGELTQKVDGFFARVTARHGTDMQCQTGCADCCRVRLTITAVEAAAVRALVAGWSSEARRALAPTGPTDLCAALDGAGRCKIYEARPLVCRSHGVPIRLRRGSMPVVQACHRNFTHTTADPDCILDQATLSAMLYAIDAAEAASTAGSDPGAGRRIDLAGLLADLAAI